MTNIKLLSTLDRGNSLPDLLEVPDKHDEDSPRRSSLTNDHSSAKQDVKLGEKMYKQKSTRQKDSLMQKIFKSDKSKKGDVSSPVIKNRKFSLPVMTSSLRNKMAVTAMNDDTSTSSTDNDDDKDLVRSYSSEDCLKNKDQKVYASSKYTNRVVVETTSKEKKLRHSFSSKKKSNNLKKKSALHNAVLEGNIPLVTKLLDQSNCDVNEIIRPGLSPLHVACALGNKKILELLIDNGANLSLKNCSDLTPVQISALFGHFEATQLLISHGADSKDIHHGIKNDVRFT